MDCHRTMNMEQDLTSVYFDGGCPLCRREIGFYQRRRGADAINWIDVSRDDVDLPEDLSFRAARARFHVRTQDGHLLSGGKAFAHLWTRFPAFRWAGDVASTRPVSWLLDQLYDIFLRFRPQLQRLFA